MKSFDAPVEDTLTESTTATLKLGFATAFERALDRTIEEANGNKPECRSKVFELQERHKEDGGSIADLPKFLAHRLDMALKYKRIA